MLFRSGVMVDYRQPTRRAAAPHFPAMPVRRHGHQLVRMTSCMAFIRPRSLFRPDIAGALERLTLFHKSPPAHHHEPHRTRLRDPLPVDLPGRRGLAFPCDAKGQVDLDVLSESARANYLYARAVVGREFLEPAVALCAMH